MISIKQLGNKQKQTARGKQTKESSTKKLEQGIRCMKDEVNKTNINI